MNEKLLQQGGTIFTVIVTLVSVLWYMSTKFNKLEIEQEHLKADIIMMQSNIGKIEKEIMPIPINTQKILTERISITELSKQLEEINRELAVLNKSMENYVDKQYFYRDMGIIKNDFRSVNSRIYLNTREINYLRGKFDGKFIDEYEFNDGSDGRS